MKKVSIQEVKNALRDAKFRQSLPLELKEDIAKYEQNPGCPCNISIYRKILKYGVKQLKEFYPGKDIINPDIELPPLMENHWHVINCHVDELENKLKELAPGRKQVQMARWQDEVTVVINELDYN